MKSKGVIVFLINFNKYLTEFAMDFVKLKPCYYYVEKTKKSAITHVSLKRVATI